MEEFVLADIDIILGISIFILLIFYRLGIPLVLGFLITGIIVGPQCLGVVTSAEEIETVADIGVILLLFTIGAELSLKDMWEIKKSVLIAGPIQVFLTIFATYYIAHYIGINSSTALFIGFLLATSSTAIVLKQLQARSEMYTPHGRVSLGILIFQDMIVVPMMLFLPILAGSTVEFKESIPILILKAIAIIFLVIISAKILIPKLLYKIVKTRDRELFLLSIIFIGLSIAWLTAYSGLSLALGAFLAGLIISESEYSHQALGNLVPFKDLFMSLFFVSIGMLLNIDHFVNNFTWIFILAFAVIIFKTIISGTATYILGYPLKTAIIVGLFLGQIGEFSFVLSKVGMNLGLMDNNTYQYFLAVSIITMGTTSTSIQLAPRIADAILKIPIPVKLKNGLYSIKIKSMEKNNLQDHVIIVGFGFNGKTISNVTKESEIPYIVLEMNPETVKNEKAKGENIIFGDASQVSILEHVNISKARVLVIGISDPLATRKIIDLARHLNPNIYIIARTRFIKEMPILYDLGANEVVPEEYETSIEIFTRVLERYMIPRNEIDNFIQELRADGYKMLRTSSGEITNAAKIHRNLPGIQMITLKVEKNSYVADKTIAQIQLRKIYSITLLAISRNEKIISNPQANSVLKVNDLCVILGTPDHISKVNDLFISKIQ